MKIAMIGVGAVGASAAYALMISGLAAEIVLIDVNEAKAEGEAMDLMHGSPFVRPVTVRAGTYADCAGAQIVVITAGSAQRPGETRLDLVKRNADIFGQMIPQIVSAAPDAILLIVSNPVDILTYVSLKLSGLPVNRVIGSGTVLDTARFRALMGHRLNVDPRSVHGYVIGEHGDSEVVVWSRATVAGLPVEDFCHQRGIAYNAMLRDDIGMQVRRAAYEIIARKGATYYAIGLGIRHVVESILRDQNTILTVSALMTGQFGIKDICLSLPSIVDHGGVEGVLLPDLSPDELISLQRSATLLQQVASSINL